MRIDWNNSALRPIAPVGPASGRRALDAESADQPGAPPTVPADIDVETEAEADAGGASGYPAPPDDAGGSAATANLTPALLRAALLDLGIVAAGDDLAVAEALARAGLPVTESAIGDARAMLARQPGATPTAYALARMLGAPATPAVLRALSQVAGEPPAGAALPDGVLAELSLALDASDDPREVAKAFYQIVGRLGRSTEQRLMTAADYPDTLAAALLRGDARSQLLQVSAAMAPHHPALQDGLDAAAAHIEGQQLLNQLAVERIDPPVPLYFSFPALVAGAMTAAEVQVWTRRDPTPRDAAEDDPAPACGASEAVALRAVIRVAPRRLGRMEIRLTGRDSAHLACDIAVERPATERLLSRPGGAEQLAAALENAGWIVGDIAVRLATDFPPLWQGGITLASPRGRVDRTA